MAKNLLVLACCFLAFLQVRCNQNVAFVFITGPWEAATSWDNVVQLLLGQFPKIAAVLPGRTTSSPASSTYTFDDYVSYVSSIVQIQQTNGLNVILVSSSFSSIIASAVAERNSAAVIRLVFVSSDVPNSGDSILSRVQASGLAPYLLPVTPSGYKLQPTAATAVFLNQCVPGGTIYNSDIISKATFSEPQSVIETPVILTQNYQNIPKTVIYGTGDLIITQVPTATSGVTVVQVPGGNSPNVCKPRELARAIQDIASANGIQPVNPTPLTAGRSRGDTSALGRSRSSTWRTA